LSQSTRDSGAEEAAVVAASSRPPPRYDAFAWCYEEIAALYSLGRIQRAKASQVTEFSPGDRVLYAGVGCGEDAVLAARRGVAVTAVDCAEPMLRRLRRRLNREGLCAELVQADVRAHAVDAPGYDAVTANFMLNIFARESMRELLGHLARLVRPGGKLLIADFAFPSGRSLERWLARAYYRPVNVAAWALRLCALHPLYDYASELNTLGFSVTHSARFQPFGVGPVLYESLVAMRTSPQRE
jgi:ubiquinone/menaquinone biosynthesis C-methylase UbiE